MVQKFAGSDGEAAHKRPDTYMAAYQKPLNEILNSSESAYRKIRQIVDFCNTPVDWAGPGIKEWNGYESYVVKGIASQLGQTSSTVFLARQEAFLDCIGRPEVFRILGGMRAEDVRPFLLGNEGETTLIRNNALCEEKIRFLLELRNHASPGAQKEIDELIYGQIDFIEKNYGGREIGGKTPVEYIRSVMLQIGSDK